MDHDKIQIRILEHACRYYKTDPETEFICFYYCNICGGKKQIKFEQLREYNGLGYQTLVIPQICIQSDDYLPACECVEVGDVH